MDEEQLFELPELKRNNIKIWIIEPWVNYTQVYPK